MYAASCSAGTAAYAHSTRRLLFREQAFGRNEAEIYGLRRLRGRGKSVAYMREYPGPIVGVSRQLSAVVRACDRNRSLRGRPHSCPAQLFCTAAAE